MPTRKIAHPDLDVAQDHLNTFWFNDNVKFITISLKPFLYNESFKNQYEMTQAQLKQFIECITDSKAFVACEATKKNNLHYHILTYSDHEIGTIDDFVKNFSRLGNTLSKECDEDTFGNLKQYLLKDYARTDNLLNSLYETFTAPTFEYEKYIKPVKKSLKRIITKKTVNDIEDDDDKWLCAETASEIFIKEPPKPHVEDKQQKINKILQKFAVNYDSP